MSRLGIVAVGARYPWGIWRAGSVWKWGGEGSGGFRCPKSGSPEVRKSGSPEVLRVQRREQIRA